MPYEKLIDQHYDDIYTRELKVFHTTIGINHIENNHLPRFWHEWM